MVTEMAMALPEIHQLARPPLEWIQLTISCFYSHANIRYRAEVATDFSDGGRKKDGHRAKRAVFLLPYTILQPTRALALILLSQFQK